MGKGSRARNRSRQISSSRRGQSNSNDDTTFPRTSVAKWIGGVLVSALIAALFSPIYLPRLRNLLDPNRQPVDIYVEEAPATSSGADNTPTTSGAPGNPSGRNKEDLPASPKPSVKPSVESVASPQGSAYQEGALEWALPSAITRGDLDRLNSVIKGGDDGDAARIGRWVRENGGADVGETKLRITLQGIDQKTVVTGLHAKIRDRTDILTGGYITVDKGAPVDPVKVILDLDRRRPSAAYFSNKVITIAADETVVIDLTATALQSTVTWDIELDLIVTGKKRTVTVKANSAHFRTTGRAGDYRSADFPWNVYRSAAFWGIGEDPDKIDYWLK